MNEENLIPISSRQAREIKEIASKGGKNSARIRRKKKEEKAQRESLSEILKNVIYSEVKPQNLKNIMKNMGIENGNNYFAALSASVLLKSIKKGDINALVKIMELLGESGTNNNLNSDQDKSFNNLIEAIKNV